MHVRHSSPGYSYFLFPQDEEGTEIITFSGTESGSRHVLQNSGARTADQDGDDEDGVNDSENPLLANRGTNNVTLNKK